MTREEAIHFATCLKNNWTINFADMEDFCDMAIEALSAPQTDSISRAEAIKAVENLPNAYNGWSDTYDKAYIIGVLEDVPSAEAPDVYKAHEEEHLTIVNSIKELQYAIAKTQTVVGEMVESADAVQGWRTGKPKKQGEYIVTVKSMRGGMVELLYYGKPLMPNYKVKGMCWYRSDDEWGDVVYDDADILAWMPLPTPYKGGDDE